MHLWKKEMYGVQIREHLAIDGYFVEENQLYPALKNLMQNGFIEINSKKGKKKLYKSTESGKKVLSEYMTNFFGLFNERIQEKLLFVRNEILEYIELQKGMVIADFSRRFSELQLEPMVAFSHELGPIGRIFIHNLHPRFYDMTIQRVKMMGGQQNVTVLNPFSTEGPKSPLQDGSADLALSIFTLHLSGMDWIINEIARVLKPGGKAVIVASHQVDEIDVRYVLMSAFIDMVKELFPFASRLGVSKSQVEVQLKENGLTIIKQKEGNGAFYLLVTKS